MSADNQQERLNTSWIVGFTDGEGCFHISINKLPGMSLGWQVLPEFRIVQHEKDESVLYKLKDYFGFGDVKINNKDSNATRKGFRVRGLENLNKIVKFFEENNEEVFFSRQLEVQNEHLFFHWVTNRAIKVLEKSGKIRTEKRKFDWGGSIILIWNKSYRYHKRKASNVVKLVEEYSSPEIRGGVNCKLNSHPPI